VPRTSSELGGPRPRAHSLLMRLWPESRDFEGQEPLWRGSLSDLDGSNTRYFDNGCSLCALVADCTGAPAMHCVQEQRL
jgi:hypothetical protein